MIHHNPNQMHQMTVVSQPPPPHQQQGMSQQNNNQRYVRNNVISIRSPRQL